MDHTYPIATATTGNGIRVAVNPDPWVSGVAVNLWYGVGSVLEEPGKTGFAHLFEHLMFAGSAQVGPGEYAASLQAIGGGANATTSFDRTNYFETVPEGGLELALWLEAERLSSLMTAIDRPTLDTEREVVKEEKRQRYDNVPYGDAMARLLGLVFPADHGYAHLPIGSMADLDAASLTDVQAFFERYYAPSNLILTLSGAVEPAKGFELVETYFGHIPPGRAADPPRLPVVPRLTGVPRLTVTGDVPQDVVYCAWLVPPVADPRCDHVALGLQVLAGSMTSRLYRDLVRTELADSVDAYDLGLQCGSSLVVATAACAEGVEPDRLTAGLLESWDAFCTAGPTPAELTRAVLSEDRAFLAELAAIEDRADQISAAWSLFGDAGEINRHLDTIHAIGADDVTAAFSEWLRPEYRAQLTYRGAA